MNPFDNFKNIYCINLDRRKDRWEKVQKEFEFIGILNRVNRFSAVEHEDGKIGLIKSFLTLFKLAKQEKMENILIFEDDVKFINNPIETFEKFLRQSRDINWEMIYLGAFLQEKPVTLKPNIFLIKNALCAHATIYKHTLYDTIINQFEKTIDIKNDDFFSNLQRNRYALMINPIIATQTNDYSDLERSNINHHNTDIENNIYYKKSAIWI